MIRFSLRRLLPMVALALLAACSWPRAHANLRVTPGGVKVQPSLSTVIGGIGVTVTQ